MESGFIFFIEQTKRLYSLVFVCSFFVFLSFASFHTAQAATLAHSSVEITFEYETQFRSLSKKTYLTHEELEKEVRFQQDHLFGLFQSPEYGERFGSTADLVEGFAGTKFPKILKASYFNKNGDPYLWISYRARGYALLINQVANSWFKQNTSNVVRLPLLSNFPEIYKFNSEHKLDYVNKRWLHCSDKDYEEATEFSYFYDPFRPRCEDLGREPLSTMVDFHVDKVENSAFLETRAPLEEIRSDNGNGRLVMIYLVNGFYGGFDSETPVSEVEKDDGWKLYSGLNDRLSKRYGFERMESLDHLRKTLGPDFEHIHLLTDITYQPEDKRLNFSTYVKKTFGKTWVIRNSLIVTDNELIPKPLRTFPKFWKEAWENGDFIYYGGHSGDGITLKTKNVRTNLEKLDLEDIQFPKKPQIAFFDACSSYTYYQIPYALKNPYLHVMGYGLVSLYHLAQPAVETMLDYLLGTFRHRNVKWTEILKSIEKRQLKPHMQFNYDEPYATEYFDEFSKKGDYPGMLLNVWVPESY